MSETLYKKVGKKYTPVAEHDVIHSYPEGFYLLRIQPGCNSTSPLKLHPRYAQLEAALHHFKDDLVSELAEAATVRTDKQITAEQQEAWDNMLAVMGDNSRMFFYRSLYDIVDVAFAKLENRILEYNVL